MSTFLNVTAEQNENGQWCVCSDYWKLPAADARTATRLCEVIQAAYKSGRSDLQNELAALIIPPMEDGY